MDYWENGVVAGRRASWHGKEIRPEGKEVLTADEMFGYVPELASDIDQREIAYMGADGEWHVIDDRVANVRVYDEQMIGMVGKDWKVIPPKRIFRFMDDLVDKGAALYESAFTMKGGSQVALLMKRPDDVLIGGYEEERMQRYIAAVCGYDTWGQALALTIFPTNVRIECWNTMMAAIRGMNASFSIPHTGDLEGKLNLARATLDMTFKYDDEFAGLANKLIEQPFAVSDMRSLLDRLTVFQPPEKNDTDRKAENRDMAKQAIVDYFRFAPNLTETPAAGTKWAAWNAVSEWSDWDRTAQTKRDPMARWRKCVLDTSVKDEALALLV